MITIFQGTLGSGKSASMVVDMCEHLQAGGVVAANFSLVPDWAERLAGYNIWSRLGLRDPAPRAACFRRRFRQVQSIDDVWQASDDLIPQALPPISNQREGRGRLYLDECQLVFNSRQWSDNSRWIHFFSQSRKLKWDVYLVAHSINMIDKQIRPFIEFETRFRDLRKVKFLGLLPMAPARLPIFMAITRYAGIAAGSGEIAKRRAYPLIPALAGLYDSALVFGRQDSGVVQGVPEPREAVALDNSSLLPRKCWPGPRAPGLVTQLY